MLLRLRYLYVLYPTRWWLLVGSCRSIILQDMECMNILTRNSWQRSWNDHHWNQICRCCMSINFCTWLRSPVLQWLNVFYHTSWTIGLNLVSNELISVKINLISTMMRSRTDSSVGWASGCHAGGREFNSGRTKTVKNIWLGCFAPGSFMSVCGCHGRLHMHSADPVELHWPWKAPWGSGPVYVYVCVCVCVCVCTQLTFQALALCGCCHFAMMKG